MESNLTDDLKDLVSRAKKGDIMAFSQLYELNMPSIYRYVYARVGNKYDAEDITSQTLLKMIDFIGKFSWQKTPFKAWLLRIAHNLYVDHYRKVKRVRGIDDVPAGFYGDIEQKAEEKVMIEKALKGIDKLDEKYRTVLLLRFVAGLSNKETSAFLRISQDNARTIQHRALKMLRGKL